MAKTNIIAAFRIMVSLAIAGLGEFNLRNDWEAWDYARETLAAAPAGTTITTNTDEHTFALWYAQRAGHLRPDVKVIDVRFLDPVHQR